MQLVLCKYPTVNAVAAGADMHVCGALFDGETVRMVAEARWSLENMAIRVPDGRFPRMGRMQKYFDKGFDIVLPGLDVAKMPQGYLPLGLQDAVVTGAIRFAYTAITGNRISLSRFLIEAADADAGAGAAAGRSGDYGEAAAGEAAPDSRTVLYENIARLAKYTGKIAKVGGSAAEDAPASTSTLVPAPAPAMSAAAPAPLPAPLPAPSAGASAGEAAAPKPAAVPDFNVFAEADYVAGVLSPWPCLTPRQVLNTYTGVEATISSEGKLNMRQFARFVAVVQLRKLLADVAASAPEANVEDECDRVVAEAVREQVAASNAALPALAAHFENRTAPVLAPSATFMAQIEKDADVFYGRYRKTP